MDKELIEHITTQLQNHEEPYAPGAWERFSAKEEKKHGGFVLWPLWTAAALILIFSGLFFMNRGDESPKNELVKSKTQNPQFRSDESIETTPLTDQVNTHTSKPSTSKNTVKETQIAPATNQMTDSDLTPYNQPFAVNAKTEETTKDKNNDFSIGVTHTNIVKNNEDMATVDVEKEKPKTAKKLTFEDLLALDSKNNQQNPVNKSKQPSKWQPDVYVAPSMGNDSKVNMNYGFSLSYAIANKLSISSGVSYASLSSTESQNAAAPQSLSGKNLESIDAKVQGINVPLELRYKISDKLYTGVGISALAVLNNSQQNTYIVNQVQTMSSPSVNGPADIRSFIVAEKQTEPQPESKLDPDKYIGFYNFSLGYKQKISKKNNIAIEPFLRLPMKTFSRENLNLTNGGLRLKVDF